LDDGVILGYLPLRVQVDSLAVGARALIRRGTIIYAGTEIGDDLETGHNVIIREQNSIGDNLSIWSNSIIDYGCQVGKNVKIHSNVYVCQFTMIEDGVFIGPSVTLTNDVHPGCPDAPECMKGPILKLGSQIGAGSCVLPRVTIGEYAVIGAGSVVTKDIPPGTVACGNPARVTGEIGDIVCSTGRRDGPYKRLSKRC
jgi:acetyltransferase-like isoleucine patch superfamily enzyme